MSFKIDLNGVDAWEGNAILPPGKYHVTVDSSEEGTSSSGQPQLELELRCVEGEQAGGSIRDWIVVSPKTAGKVKQILAAFGVGDLEREVSFSASDLLGKHVVILVRNELYDGKEKTRVKGYSKADGQPVGAASSNGAAQVGDSDLPF